MIDGLHMSYYFQHWPNSVRQVRSLFAALMVWFSGCEQDPASTPNAAVMQEPVKTAIREPDNSQVSALESTLASPAILTACKSCQETSPELVYGLYKTIAITELEDEYRRSRTSVDSTYKCQPMRVSAAKYRIGLSTSRKSTVFLSGKEDDFEVKCQFDTDPDLSSIPENQNIEILGLYTISVLPVLTNCILMQAEEPLPKIQPQAEPRNFPAIEITAEELESNLQTRSEEIALEYAKKRLRVTGQLTRIAHALDGEMAYRLNGPMTTQFFLKHGFPWYCCEPGQEVTLEGDWNRFYPSVLNCDLISVNGPPAPRISATDLGEAFEASSTEFRKSFYLKQLIVHGEVTEKSIKSEESGEPTITLDSTKMTNIFCKMDPLETAAIHSVTEGDSVTITGWVTKESPTTSIILSRALLWRGE